MVESFENWWEETYAKLEKSMIEDEEEELKDKKSLEQDIEPEMQPFYKARKTVKHLHHGKLKISRRK